MHTYTHFTHTHTHMSHTLLNTLKLIHLCIHTHTYFIYKCIHVHVYTQALLRQGKQMMDLKEEGTAAFKAQRYDAAVELYTKALELDATNKVDLVCLFV
jgi:hypothetical protein